MREEVEKRVLRVLINTGLIFIIGLALGFLNISFSSILAVIPVGGFSLTMALALIAVIVLFFMALRVVLDLIRLIDFASETLLKHIPGFNPEKSPSVVRALKELLVVFVVTIMVSVASPLISSVPNIGGWFSLAISIAAFAFSVILMYDAGRTIYAAFESSIQALIDRIVAHNHNSSEREKKREEAYQATD
ncbi:MAG: hypothetical protein QXU67_00595 [Candidatus Bathyarchaeia archaeon]